MIKAPSVTSLRVLQLAANFIHLKWDDVGGNFYYLIERRVVEDTSGVNDNIFWEDRGYTSETEWFESDVSPGYTYQYRIRTTYETFEPSDWVESDKLKTFNQNAYVFSKMNDLSLSNKFITEKFVKNRTSYVDFNRDEIMAGLMGEDFVFYPEIGEVSSVENHFVVDKERHEVQGDVSGVCKDRERVMIFEADGVLYLFEKYQPVVKVSNDNGQNWVYYSAFNGRIGNPIARQCTYQSNTTTYVLGYNEIFYGRPSTDLRWSDNTTKFSEPEITFAKLGEDNKVGFLVEIFGRYIDLPADLNKRAEAMACSDKYLYVAGRNYVRRTNIEKPVVGPDGNKVWEDQLDYITTDAENRTVTKKLDVINGVPYALVTGRVKLSATGSHMDPSIAANVEASEFDGVYIYNNDTRAWKRIFGNTEEERKHISYTETDMSTNGTEIFFNYINHSIEILPDPDLPVKSDVVSSAVKYSEGTYYPSEKQKHLISFRTKGEIFKFGPNRYHGECEFVWNRRGGTRSWISQAYKAVVVYPTRKYEYVIDKDKNFTKETWNKGHVIVNLDNINFNAFSRYANGVLLYKSSGEIIGYYEFTYRVRDEVSIYWKPDHTLFTADLVQQTAPPTIDRVEKLGLIDPNLTPMMNTITPEHYMSDGGLLKSFAENYLEYLSTGEESYYNRLKNLIRNKYPKEENNFEYLFSEINRRNIYLDKEKRDAVVRFFETRASDFYSTKGVVESYKFLFKLLYNANVDIEVESLNSLEYDIVVESGQVTEDIVGTTVYTPTGRANVTYIEREYKNGKLQWRITIHNLIGKFLVGQVLKSEVFSNFTANILVGVRGKELAYSDLDYINRGRVYYTMKIKSELPLTRYRDDMVRFVHPVGFGFMGVTLLTVLINSGISLKHQETVITILKAFKWDGGAPKVFPAETNQLDVSGNIVFDANTGVAMKTAHPHAGKDPLADMGLWPDYNIDEKPFHGVAASDRRVELSPTFDAAWVTYALYSLLEGKRLKDNIGLPRDPRVPTQNKVPK